MDLATLRLLIDVAQRGSFAAAARARDLDPSSVSRAVSLAEDELGLRLFQRTTRQMSLTEAGEVYLRQIEPIADALAFARDEALRVNAEPAGTLRLTTSVAFGQVCMTPLLSAFKAAFPALTLELIMTDSNRDLVRERIDLAVRLAPSVEGDLISARLMETRYQVCASPAYLRAAPAVEQPGDLASHDCLLQALPDYRSRWLFRDRADQLAEIAVNGRLLLSNPLALREAAVAGLGPCLLADWLVGPDIEAGRLVDLFPRHRVTATSFDTAAWLVYPSRAFLPNKVRLAIDFLKAHLGRNA